MFKAIILFVGLSLLFGLSYYFNAKTPKPEGCESMKEDCAGCQIMTCSHRPKEGESL